MESSCFICGLAIHDSENGLPPNNIESLKRFLVTICKILNVTSIPAKDWNFMRALPMETSICCEKCFELLKNVQRVHENSLRIERELNARLNQVETLVLKSEELEVESSFWDWSCFEFRRRIVTRVIVPSKDVAVPQRIKEECDTARDDDNEYHDDDFQSDDFTQENLPSEMVMDTSPSLTISKSEVTTLKKTVTEPVLLEEQRCFDQIENNINGLPCAEEQDDGEQLLSRIPGTSVTIKQLKSLPRLAKKRKVIVIAEEDELEVSEDNSGRKHERYSRAAKNCATNALKCYISEDIQKDDKDKDEDYTNPPSVNSVISKISDNCNDVNAADVEQPILKKKKKKSAWKKGDPPKLTGRGSFYPFIVVGDGDTLLFKQGTFVVKTHTHLICKAYKCKFQTEFDYFPSFQLMKKHIDDNHRDVKHRQRTSHPCVLCNILFINQFEFRKHLAEAHKDYIDSKITPAICECCLTHKLVSAIRFHLFSHKNEAEKAYARKIGEGNARCLRPKESETLERNYVCDWENCTAAFKTISNLIRHKRSHLPVECRTDMAVCSECGVRILKESLDDHMKRLHRPDLVERVLICTVCDKKFMPGDTMKLRDHLRLHRGERPYLCNQCPATFVNSVGLNGHIKQVHKPDEDCPCSWCDKVYTKKLSLIAHIKRRHPEKYEWKPDFKKMSKFYYNEELEKALKEKFVGPIQMYPCPTCDVVCKYKHSLKKHMLKHSKTDGSGMTSIGKRARKSGSSTIKAHSVANSRTDNDSLSNEDRDGEFFDFRRSEEMHENLPGTSSGNVPNHMLFPTFALNHNHNHNMSLFR